MSYGETRRTISGRLAFVTNPITTDPPLPGMAFAVESAGKCYFLTVKGYWSPVARSWAGWTPSPGDAVTVVGHVTPRTDVRGDSFLTIEVESLKPGN